MFKTVLHLGSSVSLHQDLGIILRGRKTYTWKYHKGFIVKQTLNDENYEVKFCVDTVKRSSVGVLHLVYNVLDKENN